MNEAYPVITEEEIGRSLSSAIDLYGPSLLRQPERLRAYLEKHCPDATVEIAAIVAAIVTQVPQAMLAADADDDAALDLRGLVERVVRQASLDRGQARWVVRVWAHALAVSTRGLDREPPDERVRTRVDARASAAEVLRVGGGGTHVPVAHALPPVPAAVPTPAVDVAVPIDPAARATAAVDTAVAAPAAPSLVFPAAPVADQHGSIAVPTAHVGGTVAADDVDDASARPVVPSPLSPEPIVDGALARAADGFGPAPAAADEAPADDEAPMSDAADAVSHDATARAPSSMRDPAEERAAGIASAPPGGAGDRSGDAATAKHDGAAPPAADPPWMAPDGGRRRPNRLTGIAAVVGAALAVAIVLIPFARQSGTPPDATNPAVDAAQVPGSPPTPTDVARPSVTDSDAASAPPATSSASSASEQDPTPSVASAVTAPTVGTPAPAPAAAPSAAAPDAAVASAPATTTPNSAVTPSANIASPSPSTAVALVPSPMPTTAVTAISKVEDAAPVPPAAVALPQPDPLTTSAQPRPSSQTIMTGAATTAAPTPGAVASPSAKTVARPAAGKGAQPQAKASASLTDLRAKPSKSPSAKATTSPAAKATTSPMPRLASTTDRAPASNKSTAAGKEAVATKPPAGCTRADCGSVVAIRPAPGDPRIFEMTLRMDDRSIRTLVQPLPLRPGTRVKRAGSRYVPAPMT